MHVKAFSLFIILSLMPFTVSASVCDEALSGDPVRFSSAKPTLIPTVKIGAAIPGRHGGHRYLLTKIGETWKSNYASAQYDPQGDPRFFIEIFGEKTAAYFGFEMLSPTQMLVPDVVEFVGASREVNQVLVKKGLEPLPFTYYSESQSAGSFRFYLDKISEEGALPWADGGNHFVHDGSFHSSAILSTPAIVQYARERVRYNVGFFDHLAKTFANEPEKLKALKVVRRFRYLTWVSQIDEGTVDPLQILNHRFGEETKRSNFGGLFGTTYSLKQALELALTRATFYPVVNEAVGVIGADVMRELTPYTDAFMANLAARPHKNGIAFNPLVESLSSQQYSDGLPIAELGGLTRMQLYEKRLAEIQSTVLELMP